MNDPLATEKAHLKERLAELSEQYPGKYLLIQGESVCGAYETCDAGVKDGVRRFGSGPFLVRSVLRPDDAEAPDIPALAVGVPLSARP